MEYLLDKEKIYWNIVYDGVDFNYARKGELWLVSFTVGKFSKGVIIKEDDKNVIKALDALRKTFERTAIFYFVKQNKEK